MALQTSHFGFL